MQDPTPSISLLRYAVIRDFGLWTCIKKEEKIHIATAYLAHEFGSALNLGKTTFLLTGAFQFFKKIV